MNNHDHQLDPVCVYTTANQGDLALLKSLLDSESIPYHTQNEEFSLVKAGGAFPVRVLVPRSSYETARDLIQYLINKRS
jgi:hypothetical protein